MPPVGQGYNDDDMYISYNLLSLTMMKEYTNNNCITCIYLNNIIHIHTHTHINIYKGIK